MNWKINWELILQAAGIVVGAIVSLYQASHLLYGSRSTLKADLEILKLIKPSDPNYTLVKAHVDSLVLSIYRKNSDTTSKSEGKFEWVPFIFMAVFTLGFTTWTIHLIRIGRVGWAVLTGIFAIIGSFAVLGFFVDEEEKKRTSSH